MWQHYVKKCKKKKVLQLINILLFLSFSFEAESQTQAFLQFTLVEDVFELPFFLPQPLQVCVTILCSAEDWIQGLVHVGGALYQASHTSSLEIKFRL